MKILLLYGGKSSEHDISIITAMQVKNACRGHEVTMVYVDRNGIWRHCTDGYEPRDYLEEALTSKWKEVALNSDGSLYKKGIMGYKKLMTPDISILAFHGMNGEDGSCAGLMRMYNIPCLNYSVTGQSLGMDKIMTKIFMRGLRIPVLPWIEVKNSNNETEKDKLLIAAEKKFGYPMIIKPCNLGSSIAIKAVHNKEEAIAAIMVALSYDNSVIIEPQLTDMTEVNCAAYCYKGEIIVSDIEKPVGVNEILDFTDKYMNFSKNNSTRIFPYECEQSTDIKKAVKKIYSALHADGVIRADFFVANNKWYLNEINMIPGSFANYLFPDVTFEKLMDRMLEEAMNNHKKRMALSYAYYSPVLISSQSKGKE